MEFGLVLMVFCGLCVSARMLGRGFGVGGVCARFVVWVGGLCSIVLHGFRELIGGGLGGLGDFLVLDLCCFGWYCGFACGFGFIVGLV